jgi:predicted phage tail protein
MRQLQGAKDSGAPQTSPVESPDTLHNDATAKVLDLISEGELEGLSDGLRTVYYDGTPVQNEDGTFNFECTIDVRTGTQDQDYIAGFPSTENSTAIGVELRSDAPWTQAFENLQLSALRVTLSVDALEQTNQGTGDVTGYRVEYVVELSTDSGTFQPMVSTAFDGKTTSKYERTHRIDLPRAQFGWVIRVRRITGNSASSYIADKTYVESVTQVIDAKLRYPMRALLGHQFSAKQFSSIPTRSSKWKGRRIKVPTNYDPATRTYTGVWDGTFKVAWSDNPAWVLYDILLNDRYGLGDYIDASQVDRYQLYTIAQYSDELVDDGMGGREPRFTCNAYVTERVDAYKLLQDIASIFRGIIYWAGGNVAAVADMPRDPAYIYSASNVIDGAFKYVGSPMSTRYTVALVSWNDPANQYKQAVEYVEDREGIERYGILQTEITAFGCTSQGQAQRAGRWALLTSRYETETVTFQVGLDGVLAMPGQVIGVADPNRAGRRLAGRIRSASGNKVTFDRATTVAAGDTLSVVLPTGVVEQRVVRSVDGPTVTVQDAFSVVPESQSQWMVASADLQPQLFRVVSVAEQDGISMEISATQHEPQKFDAIDSGTRIDSRPITVIPPSVQPMPSNVRLSSYSVIDQGIARNVMTIAWDAAKNGVAYLPEWRKDGGEWVTVPRTGSLSVDVPSIYQGVYLARVRAVNGLDVTSTPAYSEETTLNGKTSPPPAVTSLLADSEIFGIHLKWGFPVGAGDTQRTELWRSMSNDRTAATKLTDLAYPQSDYDLQGLAAGVSMYFWARLVDTSGNVGPWYPDDPNHGVLGQSSQDATPILQYLSGQITLTQLAQSLIQQINSGGDAAVAVEQLTTALAAMYTIKTQLTANGHTVMAGIGVGVENDDGVLESQVLVMADRFAIINQAGSSIQSPFIIQNGQVFLNQAFIGQAYIGSAQIQQVLQSDNYVSQTQGWRIDKAGTWETNGNGGGGRVVRGNEGDTMWDQNGVLRIQFGRLS